MLHDRSPYSGGIEDCSFNNQAMPLRSLCPGIIVKHLIFMRVIPESVTLVTLCLRMNSPPLALILLNDRLHTSIPFRSSSPLFTPLYDRRHTSPPLNCVGYRVVYNSIELPPTTSEIIIIRGDYVTETRKRNKYDCTKPASHPTADAIVLLLAPHATRRRQISPAPLFCR